MIDTSPCDPEGSTKAGQAQYAGADVLTLRPPSVATKAAEFKESFVVGGLDFNADGTQLAVNFMVGPPEVHIWEWRGKSSVVRVLDTTVSAGPGNAIRYSVDAALLAAGHGRAGEQHGFGLVRIWDTRTGAVVRDIAEPKGASESMDFAFTPDAKFFIRTVNRGGQPGDYVVIHNTDTWEPVWGLATLPFVPRAVALSPDGSLLALGGQVYGKTFVLTPQIWIIDLRSRQVVRKIEQAFPDDNDVRTLAWSPDGRSLVAGCIVDGSFRGPDAVKIFDPATGAQIAGEEAKVAYINGLRYSADGRYLIEGRIDGRVRIWDGQHKTLLQKIPIDEHFHTALTVSRDSRYLAIGDGEHVSIWELKQ